MRTFNQFLEAIATAPAKKFETDAPIQQQIDQLVRTLQVQLNANPYMDVSKTINFYTKKLHFTYGVKAAEYWQKRTANMIQNMQAQAQAFGQR